MCQTHFQRACGVPGKIHRVGVPLLSFIGTFQFNVSNTLPEAVLDDVWVVMQPSSDEPTGLKEEFSLPIPQLSQAASPGIVYVSYLRESPSEYALASYACTLKFVIKEVDPSSGEPEQDGYEDEYQLEEVEVGAGGDYIVPSYVNFNAEWDKLSSGASGEEEFALSTMESIRGNKNHTLAKSPISDLLPQRHATHSSKSSIWKR